MNSWPEELSVYWENVCVMKKQEKENLQAAADKMLQTKGINMQYHFFGMGEVSGIDEQITADLQQGQINTDIIVSAKIDLFYNRRLLLGKERMFQALPAQFPLRGELKNLSIAYPGGYFHPCLVLPVIILANRNLLAENDCPRGWADLLDDKWAGKVLIGGVDKPVGRAFLIGMWNMFGEEGLLKCIENCRMASVPAAVLNAVADDQYPLGVVPLIFSSRGGRANLLDIWPQEGAIAIPSYVAIRDGSPETALAFVKEHLFSTSIQSFYSRRGMGVPVHPEVAVPQIVEENSYKLSFPGWDWIRKADMNCLEEACGKIKTA